MNDNENGSKRSFDDETDLDRQSGDVDDSAVGPNGETKTSGDASPEEHWRQEAEKFKNEYLYLRAEFENYKRNAIKERSDMRKFGAERVVVDLLNVLDIFDTALGSEVSPENFENFKKGMELTANELQATLGRHGVAEVPAQGLPFDPASHEALSSEETDAVPAGHVSRVFKKAYKLHDKVIRPAQVVVAKNKA